MDKKEKSINSHIDKAIGYSDKAHDELQIALNIALDGKGLSDEEKELLSVGFATGTEEAVERVADGSCNDEYTSAWDSPIRDCRISEVYRMTGEHLSMKGDIVKYKNNITEIIGDINWDNKDAAFCFGRDFLFHYFSEYMEVIDNKFDKKK